MDKICKKRKRICKDMINELSDKFEKKPADLLVKNFIFSKNV
jgi:hypothetical protein